MCDKQFMPYSDNEFQASKEPRVSEMNSRSTLPISSLNGSEQARYNRTELCEKFRRGKCYFGGNCKFAHDNSTRDGGKLHPNGGDFLGSEGHVRSSSEKLSRWFIDGRRCPNAGETKEILPMLRENSAITLVDDTLAVVNRRKFDVYCRGFENLSYDTDQMQQKKLFWKTRLCCNWKRTGTCQYGAMCSFAHGEAELQKLGSLHVQESGKTFSVETRANAAVGPVSGKRGYRVAYEQLENGKKRLLWWDNGKKVNGIYADWIDT